MPHATETTSAIFTLLTDAAHDVRELMCEQLDTMTEQQLHQLYDHSHRQPDHVAHAIQRALQNNVWQRLTKRLARWCEAPMSLVDVMYFLCEFAHIDYDPAAIDAQLEDLATRCRQEFIRGGAYDPKTRVNAIAEVLGNRLGFTGNQAEYYNPENSFIDSVLKQRRGVPISLSAIYLLVAQRLEVPLEASDCQAISLSAFPAMQHFGGMTRSVAVVSFPILIARVWSNSAAIHSTRTN